MGLTEEQLSALAQLASIEGWVRAKWLDIPIDVLKRLFSSGLIDRKRRSGGSSFRINSKGKAAMAHIETITLPLSDVVSLVGEALDSRKRIAELLACCNEFEQRARTAQRDNALLRARMPKPLPPTIYAALKDARRAADRIETGLQMGAS